MTRDQHGPRRDLARDPVVELPRPSTAELMARRFSYPQLRAYVATNPPGHPNEQAAPSAIHLLIDDPDLYQGGSQVAAITATMSPLEIVADRRALPPGPLADALTAALARHDAHERGAHTIADPPAAVEASVTALRPPEREPAPPHRGDRRPEPAPREVEPEYFASLIDETEARITAGETDLIAEIDPADEHDLQERGRDVADYSCFADVLDLDRDLDLGDLDLGDVDRGRPHELDYACFADVVDVDASEARARASLGQARDELAGWDRRRAAQQRPSRDSEPATAPAPRLDHAALEADRARRDVAEQEASRHAGAERHADLAAEQDVEAHRP